MVNTISDEYFVKQINKMYEHFNQNMATRKLFVVELGWDEIWKMYLDNIPHDINPVYTSNNAYECSKCRHFFHKHLI